RSPPARTTLGWRSPRRGTLPLVAAISIAGRREVREHPLTQRTLPSLRHALAVNNLLRAQEHAKLLNRSRHRAGSVLRHGRVRLGVHRVDGQALALAVHRGVNAAYQAVAVQDGQHVVAVLPLLLG